MWTNVFKIGELQIISWFQFLPCDSDSNVLSAKSFRGEQKDAHTLPILSAHLSLQNEGFLTSWTNSFIGPWDPSQGVHNPDEKIKLWLFLPGRHSSVVDAAKASLLGLRVVANGVWLAPGESEEVATALSQALRNRIERALRGFSYLRYGDVFMKSYSSSTIEKNFRRMQPALEFIFSANEEAIYVHAVISMKNVRGLSSSDLERVLKLSSSGTIREGLPVIVAPHGMRGRVTGCCPSDLVKEVYSRKLSNGSPVIGVPSQSPSCQLRGLSCYVEVTFGFASGGIRKALNSRLQSYAGTSLHHTEKHTTVTDEIEEENHGHTDRASFPERTLIFPVETLLVPILYRAFARSSLKRMWLHGSSGTHLSYVSPLWDFPDSFFITCCLGFGGQGDIKLADSLMMECVDVHPQRYYDEKRDSNVSSMSSTSSTTSDGDDATRELEADADSLSCRQSSLSSNDRLEKDSSKSGYKRSRKGTIESFGLTGKLIGQTLGDPYKSNYDVLSADNPAGMGSVKVQAESLWDWDEEDNGVVMDIEELLSEFGDFGDFFEDDLLAFGEPPGTAESQTVIFSGTDGRDITSSPIMENIDVSEQNPLPGSSFPPFEDFQHTASINSEFINQNAQPTKDTGISVAGNHKTTSEFDYLAKAEAIMTLASEYSAVEIPVSEFLTAIFRTPYLPKSKRVDSMPSTPSTCIYGASPPCSPQLRSSDAKSETGSKERMITGSHKLTYYNHVDGWKTHINKKSSTDNETTSLKDDHLSSVSGVTLPSYSTTSQSKNMENTLEAGHLVLSLKAVLATVVECSMLQAAMRRIRHLLLSCNDQFPMEIDICTGQRVSDQFLNDPCIKPSMTSAKYEMKKDHVPVRIAGDIDAAIDRPVTAPVGVWRPVGAPKAIKSSSTNTDSSFAISSFIEEDFSMLNQKLPLQKILDAIPFLIQQSTSFVDVSLDACGGDGPYDWLALDEQVRRGFACGPSSVHAGCGGVLASCHSFDIAGVDLVHPLSSDVHASSVSSLLFSEVKVVVKSAFKNLDGPLSVVDWCRGHGRSGDAMITSDILSAECLATEANDSSSTSSFAEDSISPSITLAACTSSLKDATRMDEPYQRHSNQATEQQLGGLHNRPSVSLLPSPALLVGYQDDWLKTSANCLELWEKAPLEPYAHPKPVTYIAVCPDIDILTSATNDFLRQIGTVYEACKLGTHSPHLSGMQIDTVPNKSSPSGLLLIDCPQTLKAGVTFTSAIGSLNDYLQALSKSWHLNDFLITLANSLKALKFGSVLPINKVDGTNASCMVVYVICPFPDSAAITQTLVESSAALGSAVYVSEKESRTLLHSQVAKDLSCAAALDEASISNVAMLSGFSIPKLVLQIVTLDLLLRVDTPRNELAFLKDLAFTVYNKARRKMRSSNCDMIQSSFPLGRSQSTLMHVSFPTPGLWKGEHDSALRPGTWDNSWQTLKTGALNCDSNRSFELFPQDNLRCMFEPLFILAEPGYVDHGISFVGSTLLSEPSNLRSLVDDSSSSSYMQASGSGGNADVSSSSILDGSDHEHKTPSLHCCYGWTEDWRWLISIWTDSKGELLDSQIFPFGGISSRQDTKVLQCLFVQVLHQGCQIISSSSPDSGSIKARDIIITRIGCFFELECQEWQKAIYSLGGNEIKKWPVQLRKSLSGISLTNNGTSLQQQDISLIQERSMPSSPIHSMYSPHVKSSRYIKGASGQSSFKKTFTGNQVVDPCGLSQLVQSISLVSVSVDHSLHLMLPADASCLGGVSQTSSSSNPSGYLDGFSAIKSLGTISSSYLIIPYRGVRYLPTTPMQLPSCLTSESPPLAHLLHSKGSAIPLSTGYVVSKAVPNVRRGSIGNNDECPSILLVSLVDHYSGNTDNFQEKMVRGGNISNSTKQGRSSGLEANIRHTDLEKHLVLESVSAELHSLSWLTASPVYPERHTALPFHCDMLLRSRRLLYYADKQLTRQPDKKFP